MKVVHFSGPAEFHVWLEKNHASSTELQVGLYKKAASKTGITYQEAVDEALCFGWIDGIVRRLDAESYTHRFTPRKPRSIWSRVNVAHAKRLIAAGKMHAAGMAAFAARDTAKTGTYSFERKTPPKLTAAQARQFRANQAAWAFFSAQAPWYRRTALHLVVSAKQEATRVRRLKQLIADSAAGRRIGELRPRP